MKLNTLTDRQLLTNTEDLAKQERELLVQVLWHLAEIQRRKLFSPSYRSLFDYAVARLGYSEDQAARRIAAMRLIVELPEIESVVANGKLSLTQLGLAQTYFRAEKFAQGHSAEHQKTDRRIDRNGKLRTLKLLEGKSSRAASRILMELSSAPERLRPETVRPVSASVSEIRISVKDETLEKIAQLKGLLAHKHPHLSTADLLDIVFDIALDKLNPAKPSSRKSNKIATAKSDPTREGAIQKNTEIAHSPMKARIQNVRVPSRMDRVPNAAVKRSVWVKAQNRCELCGSIHMLEIDHIKPFAIGGNTSSENLRLLCRNCNQRASIQIFGSRDNSKSASTFEIPANDKSERRN